MDEKCIENDGGIQNTPNLSETLSDALAERILSCLTGEILRGFFKTDSVQEASLITLVGEDAAGKVLAALETKMQGIRSEYPPFEFYYQRIYRPSALDSSWQEADKVLEPEAFEIILRKATEETEE